MIRATSIDHINLSVKDLGRSVAFYSRLFGFKVLKDQPMYKSKIIGNATVKLCLYEDPSLVIGEGINHFGFFVDDFSAIEDFCKREGVEMPYGIVTWDEGTRSIYIRDPDGYEVELAETQGGGLGGSDDDCDSGCDNGGDGKCA